MKIWILVLLCLVPIRGTQAVERQALPVFSPQFKAAVDAAMDQQTSEGRTNALIDAMHEGTDEEVFSVLPLLFTLPTLAGATHANICSAEVHAPAEIVKAYLNTPEAKRRKFIADHSKQIRSDTDRLIRCIGQYYWNGQLHFPPRPQPAAKPETVDG